jgi:hypothetical protein
MFHFLIIAVFLFFPAIIALAFCVKGYRKGWKVGLTGLVLTLAVSAIAYPVTFFTARHLATPAVLADMRTSIPDISYEVGGLTLERVLTLTYERILFLFVLPVAFTLLIAAGCLIWLVVSLHKTREISFRKYAPDIKSKLAGLALGAVTAVYIVLFLFMVPDIYLPDEAARIQKAADILTIRNGSRFELNFRVESIPELAEILLETDLIAADEGTKIELMNFYMEDTLEQTGLWRPGGIFPGWQSADEILADIRTATKIIVFSQRYGLSDAFSNAFSSGVEDDFVQIIMDFENRDGLVSLVFDLNAPEIWVQGFMTVMLRKVTGDDGYFYPSGIITAESERAFIEMLDVLPSISGLLEGKRLSQMGMAELSATINGLNTLRDSPLITEEVYEKVFAAIN